MGKVVRTFVDQLIPPEPDRNANRIFIFETPKGGVGIHFRNFKFILSKRASIQEFKDTFKAAKEEFKRREHLVDYDI